MTQCKKTARGDYPSIKCTWIPVERAQFELDQFGKGTEYGRALSGTDKESSEQVERKSLEILTTSELISTVSKTWDRVNRLKIFHPKAHSNHKDNYCQRDAILGSYGEENGSLCTTTNRKYFDVDVRTESHFSSVLQPNLEFLKVKKKISMSEPCYEAYTPTLFSWFLQGSTKLPDKPLKANGLAFVGVSCELESIYGWMSDIIPAKIKYHANDAEFKNKECHVNSISENTISPEDVSSYSNAQSTTTTISTTSPCSDYLPRPVQDTKSRYSVSRAPDCSLALSYHVNYLASCSNACEDFQHETEDDELLENKRKGPRRFASEKETSRMEVSPSSTCDESQHALGKQMHAFSGALAGIFVSLCLHPVDTVKTVVQSCHAEQNSISYIGKSIVSERGLTGLYRGISSNITSSAPISAIYTFTYESVKGALLPYLPKEYYSVAHCIAGGCASIATSFVFTPSERIKQQMQVGSHYRNCWTAFIGVIGKGGLPSLYAGWGAVLCRNVPHSVIKFYTYESLKQMILSSSQSTDQLNTLQTLCCGGVAGSTAALFTTPFDVVKTRFQTQIPGSINKYDGVFHALQEISKHEGFNGLYRGLLPRLVMYMTQGAIFFASYEFLKSIFCLDVPQLNAKIIQQKEENIDYVGSLPLESQLPSSP